MAETVGIVEARNGLGENLDLAGRRRQRLAFGIVAERAQRAAVVDQLRQHQFAALPERVEVRRIQPFRRQRVLRGAVEMAQPLLGRASFGEGFAMAGALGQV